MNVSTLVPLALLLAGASALGPVPLGGDGWVGEPIHYDDEAREDAVAQLREGLAGGTVEVAWDERRGWLPGLLEQLGARPSSQVLVFSKTSFQRRLISPETPRALYFGDEVYVGWIPGAPLLEITTIDPLQGPTFYVVEQQPGELRFERRDDECLDCHASTRTHDWPGNLVRSVHPSASGEPILRSGTFRTTQASPLEERWGGWYVTGTHGQQRHMGNAIAVGERGAQFVDREAGANLTELDQRFDVTRYLSGDSDLVALMVLEHQAEMHNLIARAGYEARSAAAYQHKMNEFFEDPEEHVSEATRRRYRKAAQAVVDHLLFRGEALLTGPVAGTSGFAREFAASGRRDRRGRSLRDLDLERRLFRYPCSYLIHSAAFDRLPAPVLEVVWAELWEILNGREVGRDFSYLSSEDRGAILEILRETKGNLPPSWRS